MAEQRSMKLYKVPAGTAPAKCRGVRCGKTIYFVRQESGKNLPVDCAPVDIEGCRAPSEQLEGVGVAHFQTCPDANAFTRKAAAPPPREERVQAEIPLEKPRICIFCGCTAGQRCTIPKGALDAVELDVHIGRLDVIGPADLPRTVECYFIQLDPPICSAPPCKAQRTSLPLRMRVARSS